MAEPVDPDIELAADGLRLRAYRDGDVGALSAAVRESVDTVGPWLPWCHARYGEADARSWIAFCADGWRRGEHYRWREHRGGRGYWRNGVWIDIR